MKVSCVWRFGGSGSAGSVLLPFASCRANDTRQDDDSVGCFGALRGDVAATLSRNKAGSPAHEHLDFYGPSL